MSVIMYDITLLVAFVIFIGIFLYRKRKNLKKEGLLLLYRTSWGIRLINRIGKRFKKTLNVLSYLVVGLGYVLMGTMVYLFGKIVWIYIINPEIVRAIKIPPIMPLIPYLPQVFKLDFLPPFYFTYWIIIIAIVAVVHEFAHGIFAAHGEVKIKNTGFGFFPFFFPVFLAAFVELDEKKMQTKKIFSQMSVLAAGTFANILTAIFFFGIMWLFFSLAFVPAGVTFDSYTYSVVNISNVVSINGVALEDVSYEGIFSSINGKEIVEEKPKGFFSKIKSFFKKLFEREEEGTEMMKVETSGDTYFITQEFFNKQQNGEEYVLLYDNTPAVNAGLKGAIIQINGVNVNSKEKLGEELWKYSPGDKVVITSVVDGEEKENEIVLGVHPNNEDVAYIGIGFANQEVAGLMGKIVTGLSLKEPNTYYESKFEAGMFIYHLLWWLVLVNISIALVNMLPVGIFDGGRFFYLTILAITKSEKKAKKTFSVVTYLFLLLLLVIMAFWAMSWIK